jgi:hypothetical protein
MEILKELIGDPPKGLEGKIINNHIIIDIVEEDQHYWSPQLNFRVEQCEFDENKTVVSGLIGPKPDVWSMFMFIYFFIGVLGFFISSFGIAKLLLGEYSNWILALPIAILFMLTAFGTGKYGEHLAKDQIIILKQFVRDAVNYKRI